MAREHGRKGTLYLDLAGGGSASPVTFLTKWNANFTVPQIDVTSMDDTSMVYVAGLSDSKIAVEFIWDNAAGNQLMAASQDGVARKFYLYDDRTVNTRYWFGTAFGDWDVKSAINDAVRATGSLTSATSIQRQGI